MVNQRGVRNNTPYFNKEEGINITEIKDNVKRRLKISGICPICQSQIEQYDDFQYVTTKYRRITIYTFFHKTCLIKNGLERGAINGEEE